MSSNRVYNATQNNSRKGEVHDDRTNTGGGDVQYTASGWLPLRHCRRSSGVGADSGLNASSTCCCSRHSDYCHCNPRRADHAVPSTTKNGECVNGQARHSRHHHRWNFRPSPRLWRGQGRSDQRCSSAGVQRHRDPARTAGRATNKVPTQSAVQPMPSREGWSLRPRRFKALSLHGGLIRPTLEENALSLFRRHHRVSPDSFYILTFMYIRVIMHFRWGESNQLLNQAKEACHEH